MENKNILVVEDDTIVAENMKQKLIELGYEVPAVAGRAEDSIRLVEESRPALVLMDIRLKGDKDGVEAAKEIQKKFSLPIIYVTAYSDPETMQRVKETRPYDFILKPVDFKELADSIELAIMSSEYKKSR